MESAIITFPFFSNSEIAATTSSLSATSWHSPSMANMLSSALVSSSQIRLLSAVRGSESFSASRRCLLAEAPSSSSEGSSPCSPTEESGVSGLFGKSEEELSLTFGSVVGGAWLFSW